MAASEPHEGVFDLRTFCLITGASRGLGQCIAKKFAENLKSGSLLLLIARDDKALEETKLLITAQFPNILVACESVDLSTPSALDFEKLISKSLHENNCSASSFEQVIIIHNAGSLGDITKTTIQLDDVDEFRKYFDLNVNSVICLNTKFLQAFSSNHIKKKLIVNVTSLAALHPFKSWGYYCMGKAARDMLFRVMAAEVPDLRVLSYAPGPLQTQMTITARENSADADLRKWFADAYAEGKMLPVDYTVDRLIEILKADKFKNGDHIDVYDDINERRSSTSP